MMPASAPRALRFDRCPSAASLRRNCSPRSSRSPTENRAWANRRRSAKYPPGVRPRRAIAILWRAQEQHEGWLPEAAIRAVADLLEMPHIRMLEIATFYTMFQLSPVGKKAHVQVCGTTPCGCAAPAT